MIAKIREIWNTIEMIVVILALVLFFVFLLQNTDTIHVRFLFGDTDVSTVVVILISALAGLLIGLFVGFRFRRRRGQKGRPKEGAPSAEDDSADA